MIPAGRDDDEIAAALEFNAELFAESRPEYLQQFIRDLRAFVSEDNSPIRQAGRARAVGGRSSLTTE
jgi:hypothetical protein